MSQTPYAVAQPSQSALATNKLIRNTYTLLSMTLLFSASTAGLSMVHEFAHPGMDHHIGRLFWFDVSDISFEKQCMGYGLRILHLPAFMGLTLVRSSAAYLTLFSNGRRVGDDR